MYHASVVRNDRGVRLSLKYEPGGGMRDVSQHESGGAGDVPGRPACGRAHGGAQDETPPYRYVPVDGPAVIEPAGEAGRVAMARRYLGTEEGDAWIAGNPASDDVMLRMTPEHWHTADFSKAAG
jgi:hypothetical protein